MDKMKIHYNVNNLNFAFTFTIKWLNLLNLSAMV
jgi:hypothetical protein